MMSKPIEMVRTPGAIANKEAALAVFQRPRKIDDRINAHSLSVAANESSTRRRS